MRVGDYVSTVLKDQIINENSCSGGNYINWAWSCDLNLKI